MKKKKVKTYSYKYCEYCGSKLIDIPRDNMFDKFTGKKLLWLQCPNYVEEKGIHVSGVNDHSRWLKERVTNIPIE